MSPWREANVFDGTRDETADACRAKVREEGLYYANHVYNPFFYQGTKTYLYEVYEQLGRIPDNLFIPVGNGTLQIGCELALRELKEAGCIDRFPHLFWCRASGVRRSLAPGRCRAALLPSRLSRRESPSESRCAGKKSSTAAIPESAR